VRINVNAPPESVTPVGSTNPANGRTTGAVNLDTEAQIVKSSSVGDLAQKSLHTATPVSTLLSHVSASVPANSTVLRIAYTGSSPATAQAGATAFANGYLSNRAATERNEVSTALTTARSQLTAARAELKRESAIVIRAPQGSPEKNYAVALQATLQTQVNQLDIQINQLTTTVVDPGHVISSAPLGTASAVNRLIPPISGLIGGLIVAMAAVFWREHFDKYVRNSDDLAREGVAMLAELKPNRGRPTPSRLDRDDAYRIRFDQRVASVVAGAFDTDGGVVYVAAVSDDQTRDDVADHLASTLASAGHHVELVRPASVELVTATDSRPAISGVDADAELDTPTSMLGWPEPEDTAASNEVVVNEPATLVTSAHVDPMPMSLRMRLEAARRRAQFVIIDGDPAVADAQAYILAGLSDASLLVVDPVATTRADLAEVVDQISVTQSHLLGAVMWRPGRRPRSNAAPPSASTATRTAAAARRSRPTAHAAGRSNGSSRDADVNPAGGRPATRNEASSSDEVAAPHRIVDAAR
jgi:capsular polysaccharide biosynthesis protein